MPVALPPGLSAMEPMGGAALSGKPAWIVGLATAAAESTRVPLIGRWANGAWTKSNAPWSSYGVLNAVAATSPTNAWAVGTIGTYERWPISARWNGTSWSKVAVTRPAGQLAAFADLAHVDDVRFWAAGARLVNGRLKPLVMLHRSDGWFMKSPTVATGAEAGLTDVTVARDGRLWAAGWRTNSAGQARPWVIWRSSSWQTSSLATVPAGRAALTDLSFTSAGGWAVGFVDGPRGYLPILQQWNGSAWKSVALPWAAGRSVVINAVDQDAAGRLVLAGTEIDEVRRDILAVRTGSDWAVSSLSVGGPDRSAMTDTTPVTGGLMVTGFYDRQPVTLLPCATAMTAPTRVPATDGSATGYGPEPDESTAERAFPTAPDGTGVMAVPINGTVAMDMTAAAGLDGISAPTWGGVAADFDSDGRTDVYINRHYQLPPLLMINSNANTFSALQGDLAKRDRHRCSAADVDDDGKLDLFCSIGVNKGTSNTPAELTLDIGDGGGTWASRSFGVMDGYGRGRDATFLNLEGDGHPDLYVVNEASRSDAMSSSNRLYHNVAGGGFVSAAEWGVDRSMGGQCVVAGDLTGDGRDELLVCAVEPLDGIKQGVRLFENKGGRLVDSTAGWGLTPQYERDLELADFNGDGKLDLASVNGSVLRVSLNSNGVLAKAYELPVSGAVALASGDVNGDDRPDIYVVRSTTNNAGHLMLVNGGDGKSFASMTIPQPGAGKADDVLALDYDGNGRTDFVTLNGWNVYGPVKLTAFFPAP